MSESYISQFYCYTSKSGLKALLFKFAEGGDE